MLIDAAGFTVCSYFAFVEIYKFVKTYANSVRAYMTNFTIQTSQEQYEQFINDIAYVQKIYPEYDEETQARIRAIIDE